MRKPDLEPLGVVEQKFFIPQMTSKILKIKEKPDQEPPGVVAHLLELLVQSPPSLRAQVCLVNSIFSLFTDYGWNTFVQNPPYNL